MHKHPRKTDIHVPYAGDHQATPTPAERDTEGVIHSPTKPPDPPVEPGITKAKSDKP